MASAEHPREAAPREPGRIVRIDHKHGGQHVQIPREVSQDQGLDAYEHRLYEVIRGSDWNGDGWVLTFADLLAAVGCRAPKLQLALAALRDRGLIRWEGVAKRPKRYFAATPDPSGLNLRFNRIESTIQSTPPGLNLRFNPPPAHDPPIESTIQSDCIQDSIELNRRFNPPPHPPYTESQTIIDDHREAVAPAREDSAAAVLTSATASVDNGPPSTARRGHGPQPPSLEEIAADPQWQLALALYVANGGEDRYERIAWPVVRSHLKIAGLTIPDLGAVSVDDLVGCTRWMGTKPWLEHVDLKMARADLGHWVTLGKPATYTEPERPQRRAPPPGVFFPTAPDASRYTSGRYGVCPHCLSWPHEPDCPTLRHEGRGP